MASFDAYLQQEKQEEQKRQPWNPAPSTSSGSRFAFTRIDETTVDLSMGATTATAEPLSSSSSSNTSSSFGPSGSSSASTPVALQTRTNPTTLDKLAGSSQKQHLGQPEPTGAEDGGQDHIIHTVSKFDTLAGLAIRYGVQVEQLKRINRLTTDLQMFARGTIRIPLPQAGAHDSLLPSSCDPSPHQQQLRDVGRPLSSGSGKSATGRESGGAAAAAAAAGREAVMASTQLVEAIDPELLMGVKGLRTAAEDVEGDAGFGGGKGANAVALLMALQHQDPATSRGTGHLGHRILAGSTLSLSSSSEQFDEDLRTGLGRARASSGAFQFDTSWGGAGVLGGRGRSDASRHGQKGSLFAEDEIDVQGEMARYYQRGNQKRGSASRFWGQGGEDGMADLRLDDERGMFQRSLHPGAGAEFSGALSDSSVPSSVGYTAEQMRRRGNPRTSEDAELSSGEDTDGWNSGDEYYGVHTSLRQGSGPGGIPRGGAGTRGMAGPWSASRAGARLSGGGGMRAGPSLSFESLEGLGAASTVATQWGSRMLDGLISGLRNGGSWLVTKGAGAEAGRGGHGQQEAGIDLPVLSRGAGLGDTTTGFRASYGEGSLGGGVQEATSARLSGSGGSTLRRSSKSKPSVD